MEGPKFSFDSDTESRCLDDQAASQTRTWKEDQKPLQDNFGVNFSSKAFWWK